MRGTYLAMEWRTSRTIVSPRQNATQPILSAQRTATSRQISKISLQPSLLGSCRHLIPPQSYTRAITTTWSVNSKCGMCNANVPRTMEVQAYCGRHGMGCVMGFGRQAEVLWLAHLWEAVAEGHKVSAERYAETS